MCHNFRLLLASWPSSSREPDLCCEDSELNRRLLQVPLQATPTKSQTPTTHLVTRAQIQQVRQKNNNNRFNNLLSTPVNLLALTFPTCLHLFPRQKSAAVAGSKTSKCNRGEGAASQQRLLCPVQRTVPPCVGVGYMTTGQTHTRGFLASRMEPSLWSECVYLPELS